MFCPIPGGDVSATTTGPVGDFFCDDHTHFSATGAPQIAALVAGALRTQGFALAAYLK
jgi:lysophospholipase L1-like esterase